MSSKTAAPNTRNESKKRGAALPEAPEVVHRSRLAMIAMDLGKFEYFTHLNSSAIYLGMISLNYYPSYGFRS